MKKIFIIIIFVFPFEGFAQKANSLINSEYQSIDSSGFKFKQQNYPDGKIKSLQMSIDSTSFYISWYSNGQMESRSQFKNGLPYGLWTTWYENGNKKMEGAYYYTIKMPTNLLIKIRVDSIYENDFVNFGGYTPILFSNVEYKYPRIGKWSYWYENGNLKQVSSYSDFPEKMNGYAEIINGTWLFYDTEGKPIKSVEYKNNLRVKEVKF